MYSVYSDLANHLWQSTMFAAVVLLAAIVFRSSRARVRYWLWFAASVKFLLPWAMLAALGSRMEVPVSIRPLSLASAERIEQTFAPVPAPVPAPARPSRWPLAVGVVWALGCAAILSKRAADWWKLRNIAAAAEPVELGLALPVRESASNLEPGVFGIVRPVLLLPKSLRANLTGEQWATIFAHELCHVRHRDTLTAAIHMVVEAVFWFHPLVWWIGARLVDERERACDESVLESGGERGEYARGVLNVCRHYAAIPLPCAAGVTGADLKARIHRIMTAALPASLSPLQRAVLGVAAAAAALLPVAVGVVRAQSVPGNYRFEVASIRPAPPGRGNNTSINLSQARFQGTNVSLYSLIRFAYDLQDFQLSGGEDWLRDQRFDITATFDEAEASVPQSDLNGQQSLGERIRARVQHLLAERFALRLREESKEMPTFRLVEERSGHKLKASEKPSGNMNVHQNNGNGVLKADGVGIDRFTRSLSSLVGRPITDTTGITGIFDIELKWSSDTATDGGATLYTSLREQLGLRLESDKAAGAVYVIENAQQPSEN